MIDTLRINVLPLSSSSFRLEDDLYFSDSLRQEGQPRQQTHHSSPMKVEICCFLFCCGGGALIRIDQTDYALSGNDVLIAMPGSILETILIGEDDELILLAFDRDTVPQGIRASGISSLLSKSYSVLSSVYTLSPERMDNFRQLYSATRDLLLSEKDKTIQNNILQGFAYITLGILDGWIHAEEKEIFGNVTRHQRVISAFMTDIRKFAIEQRSVSFYAARAALSPKYFSRLVIKHTGKRPLDHIRSYLALEAKCMLSSGRYTTKQVADYLNFSNVSSFTRFFREQTGTTPKQSLNLTIH